VSPVPYGYCAVKTHFATTQTRACSTPTSNSCPRLLRLTSSTGRTIRHGGIPNHGLQSLQNLANMESSRRQGTSCQRGFGTPIEAPQVAAPRNTGKPSRSLLPVQVLQALMHSCCSVMANDCSPDADALISKWLYSRVRSISEYCVVPRDGSSAMKLVQETKFSL